MVSTNAPLASLDQMGHTRLLLPGAGSALMEVAIVVNLVLVKHTSVRLVEMVGDGSGEDTGPGQLPEIATIVLAQASCPA